jgi:hypothetical protein
MLHILGAIVFYTLVSFQTTAQSQFLRSYMFRVPTVATIRGL